MILKRRALKLLHSPLLHAWIFNTNLEIQEYSIDSDYNAPPIEYQSQETAIASRFQSNHKGTSSLQFRDEFLFLELNEQTEAREQKTVLIMSLQ